MISVHPTDPDVLYTTGVLMWKSIAGTWSDASGTHTHLDHNALAWSGTRLIGANDGGVFSREETDGHQPPGPWTSHNQGLSVVQLYGGSTHPLDPNRILAGAQDNGTLKRVPDQIPAWNRIGGADGMGAAAGDDPSHWAFWFQNLGLRRTKTNGASTEAISGVKDGVAAWKAPVARCPTDADVMLAGSRRVMRAENFFSAANTSAIVWSPNSPALGPTSNQLHLFVTAIAFAPSDGSCATYAYATDEGELHLTTDAGATWHNIDPKNEVPDRFVMSLAFSPVTPDVLYVALSGFDESIPGAPGHLFRATGATGPAATWSDVGPPVNLPHNAVAVNPVDAASLYAGTDLGAWVSQDAGTSWKHIGPSNGVPNVPVMQIGFDPCGVTLFTFGRGVFRNSVPFVCP